MKDSTFIACIAGLALGIGIMAVVLFMLKNNTTEPGIMYTYDNQNRLQSIVPLNQKSQFVRLEKV